VLDAAFVHVKLMLATAGSVWMQPALVVMVLGAIGQVTVLQSIVMLDAVLLRVQSVLAIGRHGLGVDVAGTGRDGVGCNWSADGVAVEHRVGCHVSFAFDVWATVG